MSRSVLLVSYHFAPQNAIGAVRPTKLAKYLTRMGYRVTVLCGSSPDSVQDPLLKRDSAELEDVHIVRERSLLRWWKTRGGKPPAPPALTDRAVLTQRGLTEEEMRAQSAAGAAAGTEAAVSPAPPAVGTSAPARRNPLLDALYLWLAGRSDAAFARACLRELRGMHRRFDIVLSTYGPASVHTVARKSKQARVADRWIADFRDEVTAPFSRGRSWSRRYLRAVRRGADAITTISAGTAKVMELDSFAQVIHNGFDAEDLAGLAFPPKRADKLAFVHCGQMYGALRDLTPFFRALRELADEGAVDPARVELVYAGRDTGGFVTQATEAGLASCLRGYGFLPRDASLALQKSAHVLLLAAWNVRRRQGNLPGKFLEYLMLDMPVLCCVSGDVPGSELAEIMRRTRIGFCYEQASATADAPRLKAYVRELYDAFVHNRPLPFDPNPEEIAAFGYAGVARAFARLIDRV